VHDVQAKLQLHRFGDGGVSKELELPGIGSIGGFSGSHKHSHMFFTFTGFTEPGATYRYRYRSGEARSATSAVGLCGP
jgi:prolyl oligopeptidase